MLRAYLLNNIALLKLLCDHVCDDSDCTNPEEKVLHLSDVRMSVCPMDDDCLPDLLHCVQSGEKCVLNLSLR